MLILYSRIHKDALVKPRLAYIELYMVPYAPLARVAIDNVGTT